MYLDGIQSLYLSILNHHYVLEENQETEIEKEENKNLKMITHHLTVKIGEPRGIFRRWVWARIAIPVEASVILVQKVVLQTMRAIGGLVGSATYLSHKQRKKMALRALLNLAIMPIQAIAIAAIGILGFFWPKAAEKACAKIYKHHSVYQEKFDRDPGTVLSGVTLVITTICTLIREPLDIIRYLFSLKNFDKIPHKCLGTISAPFLPFLACLPIDSFKFGSMFHGTHLNLVTKST